MLSLTAKRLQMLSEDTEETAGLMLDSQVHVFPSQGAVLSPRGATSSQKDHVAIFIPFPENIQSF